MQAMIAQMKIGNILIAAGKKSSRTHMKAADKVLAMMESDGVDMDTAIEAVLLRDYHIELA